MRSDRLNLPTDTERFRRSRRIPEPPDGFISTRMSRPSITVRDIRFGRSLRIPKHRDGCSTVNRVRSSRPSLTTSMRLGRFRRSPERRDGCNVQTVQTTDLPNSSRVPFNQHSQSQHNHSACRKQGRGRHVPAPQWRDVGLRTRHNDTLRTECEFPGEKTIKSEPSTQRRLRAQHPVEQNSVFTQSSPEDREVDKEQGHQPKDWKL